MQPCFLVLGAGIHQAHVRSPFQCCLLADLAGRLAGFFGRHPPRTILVGGQLSVGPEAVHGGRLMVETPMCFQA